MLELTAADLSKSAEEYYTALMKAVQGSDIRSADSLLQLHFQKSSNMSNQGMEMQNFACKNHEIEALEDMFKKLFKMFNQYMQCKPVYENSTASPLDIAVEACDVKLLDTFLDCAGLDEKVKTRMVSNSYTHFFQHTFDQIINERKIAMVKRLLELGADVNGGSSVFPLCEAVRVGSYPLVELLCQHGADFNNTGTIFRRPPLIMAAGAGRYDLIEVMVKFGAINPDRKLHYLAAELAFVRGHMDCARLLVQHGANIDIESAVPNVIHLESVTRLNFLLEHFRSETQQYILENRHDLLMLAVSEANVEIVSHICDIIFGIAKEYPCGQLLPRSRNGDIAKCLIQKGADVNKIITSSFGSYTPLYMVLVRDMCPSSRLQIVQVLLENGAPPNIHGHISPLMFAALTVDSTDLLQLLLDYGADMNSRDKDGNTALLYSTYQDCKCNAHLHVRCPKVFCIVQKEWHRSAETIMRYAKDKDFLNAQNNDGLTALMQAARYSNVAVVSEMINQGCDVNMTDNNGNTALLYAIDRINHKVCNYMAEDIVACLVKAGSAVNWQNIDGISPLMLATNRCNYTVIELLFDAGADVNVVSKTDRSKTALSYYKPTRFIERVNGCLSQFLLRGACLSYLQAEVFHRMLLCNDLLTINKYFTSGTGPRSVRSDKCFQYFLHTNSIFDMSPLCTALLSGNISLAHHFIDIMYLSKSDLSSLMYKKIVRAVLKKNNQSQCLDLLDEMSAQPASLLRLAFVTVSSAVGTSPGRENRVNMLPIPRIFKDKLLFKSPANLTTPTIQSPLDFLPLDLDSTEHINLSDDCKRCQAEKLKKQHGIHCL